MWRRCLLAAACLSLTTTAPPLTAQDKPPPLAARLANTISERMARDAAPGVVIILLAGGAPVWVGAFGFADPAAGRPMTADALFRVESIAKPVTAWGGIAALLILWPLWATAQDYLFLFSILPGLWPWLGLASGLAGAVLAALALGPERRR